MFIRSKVSVSNETCYLVMWQPQEESFLEFLYISREYILNYIILRHTSMHIDNYLYLPINRKPPRRCLCGGEKNDHIWRERKLEGKWRTCNKKLSPSSEKAASLVLRSLVSAQRLALNKAQVTKQSHFKCHWIYLRSNYHL